MKILDTDVCIELLRGNGRVIEHRRRTPDAVATPWITAGELAYGAAQSRAPEAHPGVCLELPKNPTILGGGGYSR